MSPRTALNDHARVRELLVSHAAGLLEPAQEKFVQDHLDQCPTCTGAFETLVRSAEGTKTDRTHLPESLLVRWPQASAKLRGLERTLVQQHLEGCEECRADLRMLGHDPVLSEAVAEAKAPALDPRPERAPVKPSAAPRPLWVQWGLGAWATAATMAAILLVTQRAPATDPDTPQTPATESPQLTYVELPEAFEWTRGAAGTPEDVKIAVPNGRDWADLPLPRPSIDFRSGRVTYEIRTADDSLVVRTEQVYDENSAGRATLHLLLGRPPLPAGRYVVRMIASPPAGGAEERREVGCLLQYE